MTSTTLEAPVVSPPVVSDEERYEIIDGRRVELPPMSAFAGRIASRIVRLVGPFADAHDLGEVVAEVLFRLPLPRVRNRRPDVAFVSYRRWPKGQPQPRDDNAWDVVPDIAVEVISPTELAEEILDKLNDYFQAGVSLVWVVYPSLRLVYVYESLTRVRGLTANDELDGGAVLPGFRVAVATLFPQETPPQDGNP